jgi:1-acyl-sn-glycerol-3-phosphate acyltransferase
LYFYRVARIIVSIIFRIIFRIEINGKENIPMEGPLVVCSNHISNLDPIILGIAFPRPIIFMAKKELFNNKLIAKLITGLGAFPVDRKGSDIAAIKTSFRVLKNEQVLGIFPEGTRVHEMDLDNVKPGIGLISIKNRSPVIPIFIDSNYKLFSKVVVNIGEPILFDEYHSRKLETEDYLEVSKEIMKSIYSLKNS